MDNSNTLTYKLGFVLIEYGSRYLLIYDLRNGVDYIIPTSALISLSVSSYFVNIEYNETKLDENSIVPE